MEAFLDTEGGQVAIIRCVVNSSPAAQLALYKGTELVASSSSKAGASERVTVKAAPNALRVEIKGVVQGDEGKYNFRASNAYGNTSGEMFLHLQTVRVLITPSTEVQEGEAVSLTCDVMGSPAEDTVYSWYRNSKQIQESTENSLAFPRVASGDAGSYHCKAQGTGGSISSNISPSISLHVY
uniref:Ig-like domain-containing protein n=1 Tax=Sphenodon punctatus TaxID=8508 RepID=A0A8D0HGA1_SPHPU